MSDEDRPSLRSTPSAGALRARVLTAAVAAPLAILVVAVPGGLPFIILLAVVFVSGFLEAFRLLQGGAVSRATLTILYLGVPLAAFAYLRIAPPGDWSPALGLEPGARLVLTLLITTWAGDTAAYFVGRSLGKHKLAPRVSPGKTWEGAVANLVASVAVALGLAHLAHLGVACGLTIGLAVGVLGQAGDLLESAIKRRARVKDSGTLFPGHGGILDRIDSLLLPAPFVALVLPLLRT
ncbi:MAG: phosphatidate cytidylyltransferase [Fimbriimonadia bacterium]|jgi:phosphatidate cytidylyltransferase